MKLLEDITIRIRALWYLKRKGEVPPDVRSFVIKRALRTLRNSNRQLTPEQQEEFVKLELNALTNYEMSIEAMNELASDLLDRLGSSPTAHCSRCGRLVFTDKAVKIGEEYFCIDCSMQAPA